MRAFVTTVRMRLNGNGISKEVFRAPKENKIYSLGLSMCAFHWGEKKKIIILIRKVLCEKWKTAPTQMA